MELEKNIEVNNLISVYGMLLNDNQLKIMKQYYFYDNSLSEIADSFKITRQAVSDLLNRVVKTLYEYENKLKLIEKRNKINSLLSQMNSSEDTKVNKIKQILEE